MFLCKYNTAITASTSQSIKIPIVRRGVVDYAVGADWTPAAGDVKVSKDGGAAANIATLPTAVTMGNAAYWEFVFSGAELSCGNLVVTISDSATKVIEDQCFLIRTFGNASAFYQWDMTAANLPANVTQLLGTAWLTPGTAGTPDVNVASYATGKTPLQPATAGRTLVVDAAGLADANVVKVGPTGSGTAQTAANIGSLVAKFAGITVLANWLGMLFGKQTGDATALTELKATGAGSGTFDPTTDSLEAAADGDFNATEKTSLNAATPNLNVAYDAAKTAATQMSVDAIPAALFVDGGANKLKVNTDHSVNATGGSGTTGAFLDSITVNDGTDPIEGAIVRYLWNGATWFIGTTDINGAVSVPVDAHTYTVAITCPTFNGLTAQRTVTADGSHTYSLVKQVITPSTDPHTTCYLTVLGNAGAAKAGVQVRLTTTQMPEGTGTAVDNPTTLGTTDSNGLVQFIGQPRQASYRLTIGTGLPFEGITSANSTTPLVNALGQVKH